MHLTCACIPCACTVVPHQRRGLPPEIWISEAWISEMGISTCVPPTRVDHSRKGRKAAREASHPSGGGGAAASYARVDSAVGRRQDCATGARTQEEPPQGGPARRYPLSLTCTHLTPRAPCTLHELHSAPRTLDPGPWTLVRRTLDWTQAEKEREGTRSNPRLQQPRPHPSPSP